VKLCVLYVLYHVAMCVVCGTSYSYVCCRLYTM